VAPKRESDGRAEWLDVGTERPGATGTRWLVALVALVVLVAVISVAVHRRTPVSAPDPQPTRPTPVVIPTMPPSPATRPTRTGPPPRSSVQVTELARPLLSDAEAWEIVGWSDRGVIRVAPSDGILTRTSAPPLASSGPLTIATGRRVVIVRPADAVDGYVVRDGSTARRLSGSFARASFVFPGPDQDHLWTATSVEDDGAPGVRRITIALVDLNGRATGETLPLPHQGSEYSLQSDGLGYLVSAGTGGFYVARPAGLRKVTGGSLLAVGSTRWLTYDCDDRSRCRVNVVDRADGVRRQVPGAAPKMWAPGLISPDGRLASVLTAEADGQVRLELIDLSTGARRNVSIRISTEQPQVQSWSPDGRWLLVLDERGRLMAVDPATAKVRLVSDAIPPMSVITIRSTS